MNRVKIKMRCFPFRILIVCWILNRCKIINIHIVWNYDDPTWMLSCCSLNPSSTFGKTIDFSIPKMQIMISFITLDESVRRLIRHCTDRTSTINIVLAKQNLRIIMSLSLIIARKIQINIGHLITMES